MHLQSCLNSETFRAKSGCVHFWKHFCKKTRNYGQILDIFVLYLLLKISGVVQKCKCRCPHARIWLGANFLFALTRRHRIQKCFFGLDLEGSKITPFCTLAPIARWLMHFSSSLLLACFLSDFFERLGFLQRLAFR